jgi:hypothetical protein
MSEEREIVNRELLGSSSKQCALCGLPYPSDALVLVSAEVIGHAAGGNVDICADCHKQLHQGQVEPPGDPEP